MVASERNHKFMMGDERKFNDQPRRLANFVYLIQQLKSNCINEIINM